MSFLHNKSLQSLQLMTRQPLTYLYVTWCRKNNLHNHLKRLGHSNFHSTSNYTTIYNLSNHFTTRSLSHLQLLTNRTATRHQFTRHATNSAIFNSDQESNLSNFEFDHGLEDRLGDVDKLKSNVKRRGGDVDIDKLVEDYKSMCRLKEEKQKLESKRESVAAQIAAIVKHQKAATTKSKEAGVKMKKLKEEGKQAKESLKSVLQEYWKVEERMMLGALSLPNHTLDAVTNSIEVLKEGFIDDRPQDRVDHLKVLEDSKCVKLSNVGAKAYYLTGRLAVLEQELIQHFSSQLANSGSTFILAPEMFKTAVVEGSGVDVCDPASTYRIQHKQGTSMSDFDQEHSFLIGCSHISFTAYLSRMMLQSDSLPQQYYCIGRSYRPENEGCADLPGLLGVLQSVRVCSMSVCGTEEDCLPLLQRLQDLLITIYQQLHIPYRVVSMPVQSLQCWEQNRIELQLWIPSLQDYIKVGSVSVHGDYNSRRLMIRHQQRNNTISNPVHMVYAEITDITTLIAALLEYDRTYMKWNRAG